MKAGSALDASVTIGVVGAGAMGAGIAQVAALAGHRVWLFDTRVGAADAAITKTLAMVEQLLAKGRVTEEQASAARGGMRAASTLQELGECGLVIEAIVEDIGAKRALFSSLEGLVRTDALLASNTSSISITAIGSALKQPARLAGMHFFNPAPLMPLVEIISGAATSKAAARTLYATAERWGKTPVFAKSTPGFIVNRVARPFYAEALRVLQEGGADCATIDAIMRDSGGFRMGPFELMDLIGHDVNYAVTRSVFDAFYADRRFTPSLLQLELVEAGFLGRKTGRGFYQYGEGAVSVEPANFNAGPVSGEFTLYGGGAMIEALSLRLPAAGVPIQREAAHADGRLAGSSDFKLYLCDGRTATQRAEATGIANCVLVDTALDFATASRVAIACSDGGTAAAGCGAAALLSAAGYKVSVVDDVPGMVVLRTMAMLANEAADAVNQGVCSAADCDLAMKKGVNYPVGPLAWADEFGNERVVAVLDHLQRAYGEERYRVSPLLRRKALSTGAFFVAKETAHG